MTKLTEEEKQNLKEKLEFLDLNLEEIPGFLKQYKPVDFRISRSYKESEYKIYGFVPIEEIQILITPTTRLDDIKQRYELAKPISSYIEAQEENKEEYEQFLEMLQEMDIQEIREIEEEQNKLNSCIPFRIKYKKNYIWQIFYSEITKKYFMLVPSEDLEVGPLFYIIKKQIEAKKNPEKAKEKIFVPINGGGYSLDFLGLSEIEELENELWLFTKDWPSIYEVTDKNGITTMQIVGDTTVYENMTSTYKVVLKSTEEASCFFKLIKALFLLQTELSKYYQFTIQINDKSELEFFDNNHKIEYENLADYLINQYKAKQEILKQKEIEVTELEKGLKKEKEFLKEREKEYLSKQKEISTFLECRKTFFGKVKYYFRSKKTHNQVNILEKQVIEKEETKIQLEELEEKDFYTIEDLIKIHGKLTQKLNYLKNMSIDKKGVENQIQILETKIQNAISYIQNIEKHKKSIFEFWKFANKDKHLALAEGKNEEEQHHIKKVFDYEMDKAEFAKKIDRMQRNELNKHEQDAVFLTHTDLLEALNHMKENKQEDVYFDKVLQEIKKQIEQERISKKGEEYDIFGNITANQIKLKELSNQKHRETQKEKLRLINVTNPMQVEEFKQKLQEIQRRLEDSFGKVKAMVDMPLYQFSQGNVGIRRSGFDRYHINVQNAFDIYKNQKNEKWNLYKINLQEGMPAIYYTNIMFYDNKNLTLPLGMDIAEEVLINADLFEFHLVKQCQFKVNQYSQEQEDTSEIHVKTVNVYEYDLIQKETKQKGE